MKTAIYVDEAVTISSTNTDYDYIGFVENSSNEDIRVVFFNGMSPILVPAGDWEGIIENNEGYAQMELIENKQFELQGGIYG